jgi:hypothetical protein
MTAASVLSVINNDSDLLEMLGAINTGGLKDGSPPMGCRGKAMVRRLGDKNSQSWKQTTTNEWGTNFESTNRLMF